jgi:DNA-binding response OmpR family regulator
VQSGQRILVVEDDDDVRALLCRLLETAGYRVEVEADGAAAAARVKAEAAFGPPDAVVLDVMLPGMSGLEVCQELKFHRDTNLIPIVMMTALSDHESRRKGLWVGANAYLTKPFDSADLLREVRRVLDHRRALTDGRVHTRVELCMESDGHLREQLNDFLSRLFLLTPLSEEEVHRIRYAVMEMTDNAIEWGNRRRKELTVNLAYEVTDRFVKFVITDQGQGFNPQRLPHAAAGDDPVSHMLIREKLGLRDGGFGIMITRGMVDDIQYNQTGNQVTLVKWFGAAGPATGPAGTTGSASSQST